MCDCKKKAGRPKKWDREEMGKKLLAWAQKSDSINLNAFCCQNKPSFPPSNITRWANDSEEFNDAYETAKAYLAVRREKMLNENKLHVKTFDMNATVYDFFLRSERRAQSEFEAKVKAEAAMKETEALTLAELRELFEKDAIKQR